MRVEVDAISANRERLFARQDLQPSEVTERIKQTCSCVFTFTSPLYVIGIVTRTDQPGETSLIT